MSHRAAAGAARGAGGTEGALCRLCGVTMAIGEKESKQIKQNTSRNGGHFRASCKGLAGSCFGGAACKPLSAFQSRSWRRNAWCEAPGQQRAKSDPRDGMGWDGMCELPDLPGCRRTLGTPVFRFCCRPPTLSSERLCVGRGGISEPMDGIFPLALFCICFPRCSTGYFAKCHQWACWAVDSPPRSPARWAMGKETLQAHEVEAVIAVIWSGLQRWFPAKQDWFGAERLAGWFH